VPGFHCGKPPCRNAWAHDHETLPAHTCRKATEYRRMDCSCGSLPPVQDLFPFPLMFDARLEGASCDCYLFHMSCRHRYDFLSKQQRSHRECLVEAECLCRRCLWRALHRRDRLEIASKSLKPELNSGPDLNIRVR